MDWVAWLKYGAVGLLSWFVVSRLEFGNLFVSLLVRGSLSMLVYFGLLYVLDARTRELAGIALRVVSRTLLRERAGGEGSAA